MHGPGFSAWQCTCSISNIPGSSICLLAKASVVLPNGLAQLGACRIAHALQENLAEMFLTKTVISIVCLIVAQVQFSAAIDGVLGEERGNL